MRRNKRSIFVVWYSSCFSMFDTRALNKAMESYKAFKRIKREKNRAKFPFLGFALHFSSLASIFK